MGRFKDIVVATTTTTRCHRPTEREKDPTNTEYVATIIIIRIRFPVAEVTWQNG